MRLAYKLIYAPMALKKSENEHLRQHYGITGYRWKRALVKDVAKAMGFGRGNNLSNRLYKVRQWYAAWEKAGGPKAKTTKPGL